MDKEVIMPSELRHLVFKPTEIIEAILAHRRLKRLDTPVGTIVNIGILDRPERVFEKGIPARRVA
jgi:hypothetical protein